MDIFTVQYWHNLGKISENTEIFEKHEIEQQYMFVNRSKYISLPYEMMDQINKIYLQIYIYIYPV